MLAWLEEEADDDGQQCNKEREEGPGDKLERVDLQSARDEDPGNAPRHDGVDGRPGIVQNPGEVFPLQAELIKGGKEGLAREDDGEVVFTDHQVDADTGDGGGQGQSASRLHDSGQVVDDGVDDVELNQETTECQGEDNQGQGSQHTGDSPLGEQGVNCLVVGVGNVAHHDCLGNGGNTGGWGVDPAECGSKEGAKAQRRDGGDLQDCQDD